MQVIGDNKQQQEFPGVIVYSFQARATGLPKKDFFGKSDPYLVFRIPIEIEGERRTVDNSKKYTTTFEVGNLAFDVAAGVTATTAVAIATGVVAVIFPVALGALGVYAIKRASKLHPTKPGYNEIFVSEVVKRNLNPTWSEFKLGLHESYLNHPGASLYVECWDWDRAKPSDFIGMCKIHVQSLIYANTELEFDFIDHKQRPAGKLFLTCTRLSPEPAPFSKNSRPVAGRWPQVMSHLPQNIGLAKS